MTSRINEIKLMRYRNPIGIAWFKTDDVKRYAGRLTVERYFQVMSNGKIAVIDLNRNKFGMQNSFGGIPISIKPITEIEYEKAYKRLLRNLNKQINNPKT